MSLARPARPTKHQALTPPRTEHPVMPVLEELERMGDERFHTLYEALTTNGFGPLDGEVAKALKFRPQAVRKIPHENRKLLQ